jgi:uncharacterized protein
MYYINPASNRSISISEMSKANLGDARFITSELAVCGVGKEWLVVSKRTGVWCYLNSNEWEIVRLFKGLSIHEVAVISNTSISILEPFATTLINRGILESTCINLKKASLTEDLQKKPSRYILTLMLSNTCNLACKYCYHAFPAYKEKGHISRELANAAFRYAFTTTSDELMIDFGEIAVSGKIFRQLLNDAQQLEDYYKKNVIYSIQTNGSTLTAKMAAFLKQNNIFVGLSLDGPETIHNEMRKYPTGLGSYHQALVGLNHLITMEIPFIVSSTIHKNNVRNAKEILNFFINQNISHFVFKPILKRGSAIDTWEAQGLSTADNNSFLEDVVNLAIDNDDLDWLDTSLITFLQRTLGDTRGWSSLCYSGYCQGEKKQVVLNKDGFCYPCPRYSSIGQGEFCIGKMETTQTISGIQTINEDKFNKFKDFRLSKCKQCTWWVFCKGGCPFGSSSIEQMIELCSYNLKMYDLIFKTLVPQIRLGKFKRSNKLGELEIFQHDFVQP